MPANVDLSERDVILEIVPPTAQLQDDVDDLLLASDQYLNIRTLLRSWAPKYTPTELVYGSVEFLVINYDDDGAIASAEVRWPDGSPGVFVTTYVSPSGQIDSWSVTHDVTGKTVYQRKLTRDEDERVTAKPPLLISGTGPILFTVNDLANAFDTVADVVSTYSTIDDLVEANA